jgi:ParE toxin of type II toxin-antitoxin system, parDE
MSLPIVFEPEVEADVDDAYQWYERQRRGLGEHFLAAVRATLDRIELNPELHAVAYREVRRALVRRFRYAVY